MVKKGKKKGKNPQKDDQTAAASTSSTGPATSGQQSSQQKQTAQQKEPEQKSQKQPQQPQQQPQSQQQSQPQLQQQSQPQLQQQSQPQLQQQQSQAPRAWGPRMQQPAPQVFQPTRWAQPPRQQQAPDPRFQQFTPQQPPPPRSLRPQTPEQAWIRHPQQPMQQIPQQPVQSAWARPPQQPTQQIPQQPMQSAWVRPPQQFMQQIPQQPVQSAWPRPPQQPMQQISQQPVQSAWSRPPQQVPQQVPAQSSRGIPLQQVRQQRAQPSVPISYPSTSSQQDLDTGKLQQLQTIKTVQDTGKVTEKGDVPKTTDTSLVSKLSENLAGLSTWEAKNKRMSEKHLNIPKRQKPNRAGTVGAPIRVTTNMFEIIFKPDFVTTAVHYDVKVVPSDNITQLSSPKKVHESKPKRELKNKVLLRLIFEKWRKDNYPDRHPAYDGMANAFAAREFPFIDTWVGEVNIHDCERDEDRTFEITLNKAGIVDLSWMKTMRPGLTEVNQTAVQVLDIILRHAPASKLINVGRSLFPPNVKRVEALGGGLDLHFGGFMSAVIGWKPYLNVDVVHKAFVSPANVVDIMYEIINPRYERDFISLVVSNKDKISKVLSGIKVNYAIPDQPSTKRTHRINGLGPDAVDYTFDVKGKMCSTEEYFAIYKNYKVKYPYLPCLWVGKRDGKTYLPAELCKVIPGQAINRKLDEAQTTKMIRKAATNTSTRQDKIMEAFGGIDVNKSSVLDDEFHLKVAIKMKEVDARILPPPALQYNEQIPVQPRKGVWRAKKFSEPAKLEDNTWTIVNVCRDNVDNSLPDFVNELKNQASYLGMAVGKPCLPYPRVKAIPREIERFFYDMKKLKLIIVILPNHTDAVYGTVKKISELRVGVLTQCIKIKNVVTPNNSTIQNILLKINSKLNGTNHTFTSSGMPFCLRNKKYMLIGADVSHPSPDAKDIPSVAAIAASHDETTFKYNVTIRLQQPKQEEIADLKEIMIKHIKFYVEKMKIVPEIIIFYRDGVSEGQIGMVLDKEIKSIKDACREYARERPGFNPQLTFVIVQKRHHVRIFPTRAQDTDDRNCNVKAGTIVDTEITHPNHIDFYLVSHASIQGTARPTKYRCICNESKFNEDQLEELTYYLCHMYARCTRSVSYPAPTYYAHLAAYRGRMWIQGDRYTETDFQDKNKCKLEPILKMPMSFI